MSKKILILGAGYAGIDSANKLCKKYKKDDSVEITLIDKKPYHTLMTDLHEVAGGRIDTSGVKVNLKKLFKYKKVNCLIDNINSIDFDNQKLISNKDEYSYDYLIIGTGAEPCFFGIEGAKEHSFTLWSLEDAKRLKNHIKTMFEKAQTVKDKEKRKTMLTFSIAGAGFTGVEFVGELAEWKSKLCDIYEVDKDEVTIQIIEGQSRILPILDKKLSDKSRKKLKKLDVDVMTDSFINKIQSDHIVLSDDTKINTNTLVWTAGVQGNSFVKDLDITTTKQNRIKTNEYMQSVDYENVYAIGDNIHYVEDNEEKPVPQIVETALQTAETAVENISKSIKDDKNLKPFKSDYHGFMVSIGSRYAVAELNGTKLSGFVAMAMKHLVNLHYLWGVGGFALIWSYLMHEIFGIKDNRSLLGGHFAKSTSNFWLFPLRLFIGYHWLVEGWQKIQDGWIEPGNIFIVQTAADSGASQAAENAYASAPILEAPPAFYQWILDNLVSPVAFPLQVMVVFVEIGIGLALLAGLFTFLASLGSVFLTFNFILSAMAGPDILWYTFGSIALLGGAGRVLGLDYYVMPWLKKKYKNTKFARKSNLYIE